MTLPYEGPREDGPTCRGCGKFFTMDEVQAGGHTCRVSSAELTPMQIAQAQAGCFGDGWDVDEQGHGFVRFEDPLAAREALAAGASPVACPSLGGVVLLHASAPSYGRCIYCGKPKAAWGEMEPCPGPEPLLDELELAWGIIANAGGGDWTRETPDWQKAAAAWRDRVMPAVGAHMADRGKVCTCGPDEACSDCPPQPAPTPGARDAGE